MKIFRDSSTMGNDQASPRQASPRQESLDQEPTDQEPTHQGSSNTKPNCPRCGRNRSVRYGITLDNDGYIFANSRGYIDSSTNYCFFKSARAVYACEERH